MINNPMISNPYRINVNGKLLKEDLGSSAYGLRNKETGEIQYCIPLNIESMGIRNNFLYKILLTYVKTIFNEDDMFLDMKIAEDEMITMVITVFEKAGGKNRYVLGAAYANHPFQQLEIDVLLDDDEQKIVNRAVDTLKKKADWNNVVGQAYSPKTLLNNPEEFFKQII